MRATIVIPDNIVIVDGRAHEVDCSALAADTHAVQWQDSYGEIEFMTTYVDVPVLEAETNEPTDVMTKRPHRKPNEVITDFSPYQSYVDAWQVKEDKRIADEEAAEAAREEQEAQLKADKERFEREQAEYEKQLPARRLAAFEAARAAENRLRRLEKQPELTADEFKALFPPTSSAP